MKQPASLRLVTGWSKIETLQPNAKPLDFFEWKNVEDVPHFFYFIFCAFCLLTNVARHDIIGRPLTIDAAGIR